MIIEKCLNQHEAHFDSIKLENPLLNVIRSTSFCYIDALFLLFKLKIVTDHHYLATSSKENLCICKRNKISVDLFIFFLICNTFVYLQLI